ncbi:ABC transporter permease [Actinoplanes sp. NPDC026623]|uniref:ABC transporter permease n=1 Tax=Actinoplanes sp. NPDC026623 TaxID=3155610 RepID=UPI0033FA8D75
MNPTRVLSASRAASAEWRKIRTLPASWAGAAVALLGSLLITVLNAYAVHADPGAAAFTAPLEVAFAAMPLGTVGATVIGVTVFSSEYAGERQITTSLAAVPDRVLTLAAKAIVVALSIAAIAAVTMPLTIGTARLMIGETVNVREAITRCLGAALYWILSGLIGLAITVFTRSGVVPLVVLVVNSSVVSFSLLLSKISPLGFWMPDMAGRRLFGGVPATEGGLGTVPGALVMAGWTVLLLAAATAAFHRRDA